MGIVLTAAASMALGFEICARLWRADRLNGCERALYVSIVGSSLWLASTWVLALTHLLVRPALIARTAVFAVLAVVVLVRRARREQWAASLRREVDPKRIVRYALPLIVVAAWVLFMLWRSVLLPPLTHDALSYHLPKALLFARANGYTSLSSLRYLISPRPSNYELLLAEELVLSGSDDYTEWISVLAYLGFVLAAAAMAQRWARGNRDAVLAVALLSAATPVALLHSGAHKNDLLTAYFVIAGFVAFGRWLIEGERRAFIICAAAFAAAIGTKAHGFLPPLLLIPFAGWRLVRDRQSWRRDAAALLAASALFFALGAWEPVRNYVDGGRSESAVASSARAAEAGPANARSYGDWRNIWRGAYVLMATPFSRDADELHVPWSANGWYWRRYEIYFSELGVVFPICVVMLPLLLLRRENRPMEAMAICFAAIGSVLAILPVHRLPDGIYLVGLPRFVMYLVPVLLSATIPPLLRMFPHDAAARAVVGAAALCFVYYATTNAFRDDFAPLDYVLWARQHPGTRIVYFDPYRATEVVDRLAGPHDTIAVDAGPTAWFYCAYGAQLQRTVHLIPPGSGPPQIPRDAKWLVIDRSWNRYWGDPTFTDLGDWRHRLGRGTPSPDDLRVTQALDASGEFRPVAVNRTRLQAVYRRKP